VTFPPLSKQRGSKKKKKTLFAFHHHAEGKEGDWSARLPNAKKEKCPLSPVALKGTMWFKKKKKIKEKEVPAFTDSRDRKKAESNR